MPGIAGVIPFDLSADVSSTASAMTRCMQHESFHVSGTHIERENRLGVGWVTHQNSFSDCMPIWNENKDVCIILCGEVFRDPSQITDLRKQHLITSPHDASYLVHLYEELGVEMLRTLNGTFSGLIIDRRARKLVLFNDRFGLGRIYYCQFKNGFYFASEAKSLLAVLPSSREIHQQSLAELLSVGCVLQNRTLFRDIYLLPVAACWTFHYDIRIEKTQYFTPNKWEEQEILTPAAYNRRLVEVFSRVAPRYLQGPEKSAISLTGGLDSRMLLAWVTSKPNELPCYTFGGPYRDCADVRIARQLAKVAQQPHTTLRIDEDFFREFYTLAEKTIYLSDGSMDVTGSVELYVNRLARSISPVRLTGNYGSEILRSNIAFKPRHLNEQLFTSEFWNLIKVSRETYRLEAECHRLSFIAFKQVPWFHYARRSIENSQLTPRSPFLDNELVALAYQAPPVLIGSATPLLELINSGDPRFSRISSDRALGGSNHRLVSTFAKAWQEFTAKAEYAYDYGMPPWLAKIDHALEPLHLEKIFLGRHKFYHFRVWYRDRFRKELNEFAETPAVSYGYRDGAVKMTIHEHLSGRSNFTSDIHSMLSVKAIDRLIQNPQWDA